MVGTNWEQKLAFIRGRNDADAITKLDVQALFEYIDKLHVALDESDQQDTFGTEGWRHSILGED